MKKREMMDEITNFIEYYTSDDTERMKMGDTLIDYMLDVYQAPVKQVKIVYNRESEKYIVKGDNFPSFKIQPDEKNQYVESFVKMGYEVYVG
jgi:hypothetical protein